MKKCFGFGLMSLMLVLVGCGSGDGSNTNNSNNINPSNGVACSTGAIADENLIFDNGRRWYCNFVSFTDYVRLGFFENDVVQHSQRLGVGLAEISYSEATFNITGTNSVAINYSSILNVDESGEGSFDSTPGVLNLENVCGVPQESLSFTLNGEDYNCVPSDSV